MFLQKYSRIHIFLNEFEELMPRLAMMIQIEFVLIGSHFIRNASLPHSRINRMQFPDNWSKPGGSAFG